ncbi:MAG: hypothetical protein ACJ8EB_07055 [Allosphingosinicella sp.]
MRCHLYRLAAAGLFLLGACHKEGAREVAQGNEAVSAEGQAEEGKISVHAPGFNLTLDLPKEVSRSVRTDRDSKIIYPNSSLLGMAVAAGKGGDQGGESEVEMRFRAAAPLDQVAAWYRDPARSADFRLEGIAQEGGATVVHGLKNSDRHPFKVRLVAASGGGTDGRLTIRHTD